MIKWQLLISYILIYNILRYWIIYFKAFYYSEALFRFLSIINLVLATFVAIATFVLVSLRCAVNSLPGGFALSEYIVISMKEIELTQFLVSFTGQIENVVFPAGIFDELLYVQYETVWGPDWSPVSGLTSGTSQMARSGNDPERVVFNMPIEMVFSSTNVSGWPQLVITVRAQNAIGGDALRGYGLVLMPATAGERRVAAPLLRPLAATVLGEWLAWLTGRHPELAEPRMLANGKENYLLRTESYGTVEVKTSMVSKDLRRLGYDNQPPACQQTHYS